MSPMADSPHLRSALGAALFRIFIAAEEVADLVLCVS